MFIHITKVHGYFIFEPKGQTIHGFFGTGPSSNWVTGGPLTFLTVIRITSVQLSQIYTKTISMLKEIHFIKHK